MAEARKWTDSAWANDYRQASFRGAKFWVEVSDAEIGRKTITHEFPGRDDVMVEDMGRSPRRFKLEAFVLGEKYQRERDLLINEFELPGSGELVHPFWGEMVVTVEGPVTVRESTKHGGMVLFSLTVVEKGDLEITPAEDTQEEVAEAADEVEAEAQEEFKSGFDMAAFLDAVRNSILGKIMDAIAFIQKVKGQIDAVMAIIDEIVAAIEMLSDLIVALINLPGQLAAMLQGALASVMGSINRIGSAAANALLPNGFSDTLLDTETGLPLDLTTATSAQIAASTAMRDLTNVSDERKMIVAMDAFRSIFAYGDDLIDAPSTTPTRVAELNAQKALVRLLRVSVLAETCRVVASLIPVSIDAAILVRDELVDSIDIMAEDEDCSDNMFAALQDLRAKVVKHFEQAAAALPTIIDYIPKVTLPALVVAHDIYGDATRETEIVQRNNIAHPSFCVGGTALEVLSRE